MTDEKSEKDVNMDKVVQALMLDSPRKELPQCPNCGSAKISMDSPGTWRLLFSLILLPFSLIFLFFNQNRYCQACGIRFKKM